ncbi:T9SS type A sorting domain-containing protein [Spirosoma montaniterrae]|uniref:Secretion system C-terminal sorting domain-containing protein n=1 Tax=Spirosoma montaniterrae TaxID=1178516 RepID=A0A1P9X2K2_9BACT|nr:T9SS type A sorting domain-containing protein [Spirosoma montaniterrae]AQG81828.1 hypothetical protein AWR27_22495 [Spirosoma montaniterrae]
MKTLTLLSLLLLVRIAEATHLIGGYIQTKPISGLQYEITVTLYMYEIGGQVASGADDNVSICFGDGVTQSVARVARVITDDRQYSSNVYRVVHTYPGPATYRVTTFVPNRTPARNNGGPNQPFGLSTTFLAGMGQTPALSFPWVSLVLKTNQLAIVPLKATDAEGDSLAYRLAWPLVSLANVPCQPGDADGYQYPNAVARRGAFTINSRTGDLVWDAPTQEGRYNVAIMVLEYRRGALISQTIQEISVVVVDQPGTPGTIPPYEPAQTIGLITTTEAWRDNGPLLQAYPSPADGTLQVELLSPVPALVHLTLTDANGRVLQTAEPTRATRAYEKALNTSYLQSGMYILRADVDGQILTRKVLVEH